MELLASGREHKITGLTKSIRMDLQDWDLGKRDL